MSHKEADFEFFDEELSDIDSNLERYRSRQQAKQEKQTKDQNLPVPQSRRLKHMHDRIRNSKGRIEQLKERQERRLSEESDKRKNSIHFIADQCKVTEGTKKIDSKYLRGHQYSQQIDLGERLNLNPFEDIETTQNFQSSSNNLQSIQIIFEEKTTISNDQDKKREEQFGSIEQSNFMDDCMEESLKLNLGEMTIYNSQKVLQEYNPPNNDIFMQRSNSQNLYQNQDNQIYESENPLQFQQQRPSTILEVSETNMEDTEGNKSSHMKFGGGHGISKQNMFKVNSNQSKVESTQNPSGVETPYLDEQTLIISDPYHESKAALKAKRQQLTTNNYQMMYQKPERQSSHSYCQDMFTIYSEQEHTHTKQTEPDLNGNESLSQMISPSNKDLTSQYQDTSTKRQVQTKTITSLIQTHRLQMSKEDQLRVVCVIQSGEKKLSSQGRRCVSQILKKRKSDFVHSVKRKSIKRVGTLSQMVSVRSHDTLMTQSNRKQQSARCKTASSCGGDSSIIENHDIDLRQTSQNFVTTKNEIGTVLINQSWNNISRQISDTMFQKQEDITTYISGLPDDQLVRAFEFDFVIDQNNHSRKAKLEAESMLFNFVQPNSPYSDFLVLFGETNSYNLLNSSNFSTIELYLNSFQNEKLTFFKATLMFEDKEIILHNKTYTSDTGIDMRNANHEIKRALSDRDKCINQLMSQNAPGLRDVISNCVHLSLQVNNHHIVIFADIQGIRKTNKRRVIQNLTHDFGSMTNELLKLSRFYQNFNFVVNSAQEKQTMHKYLTNNISPESKIVVMTLVNGGSESMECSQMGVDFTHKIRQYFKGKTDQSLVQELLSEIPAEVVEQSKWLHANLSEIFSSLAQLKPKIEVCLERASRRMTINLLQNRKKPLLDDFQILKSKFGQIQNYFYQQLLPEIQLSHLQHKTQQIKNSVSERLRQCEQILSQTDACLTARQQITVPIEQARTGSRNAQLFSPKQVYPAHAYRSFEPRKRNETNEGLNAGSKQQSMSKRSLSHCCFSDDQPLFGLVGSKPIRYTGLTQTSKAQRFRLKSYPRSQSQLNLDNIEREGGNSNTVSRMRKSAKDMQKVRRKTNYQILIPKSKQQSLDRQKAVFYEMATKSSLMKQKKPQDARGSNGSLRLKTEKRIPPRVESLELLRQYRGIKANSKSLTNLRACKKRVNSKTAQITKSSQIPADLRTALSISQEPKNTINIQIKQQRNKRGRSYDLSQGHRQQPTPAERGGSIPWARSSHCQSHQTSPARLQKDHMSDSALASSTFLEKRILLSGQNQPLYDIQTLKNASVEPSDIDFMSSLVFHNTKMANLHNENSAFASHGGQLQMQDELLNRASHIQNQQRVANSSKLNGSRKGRRDRSESKMSLVDFLGIEKALHFHPDYPNTKHVPSSFHQDSQGNPVGDFVALEDQDEAMQALADENRKLREKLEQASKVIRAEELLKDVRSVDSWLQPQGIMAIKEMQKQINTLSKKVSSLNHENTCLKQQREAENMTKKTKKTSRPLHKSMSTLVMQNRLEEQLTQQIHFELVEKEKANERLKAQLAAQTKLVKDLKEKVVAFRGHQEERNERIFMIKEERDGLLEEIKERDHVIKKLKGRLQALQTQHSSTPSYKIEYELKTKVGELQEQLKSAHAKYKKKQVQVQNKNLLLQKSLNKLEELKTLVKFLKQKLDQKHTSSHMVMNDQLDTIVNIVNPGQIRKRSKKRINRKSGSFSSSFRMSDVNNSIVDARKSILESEEEGLVEQENVFGHSQDGFPVQSFSQFQAKTLNKADGRNDRANLRTEASFPHNGPNRPFGVSPVPSVCHMQTDGEAFKPISPLVRKERSKSRASDFEDKENQSSSINVLHVPVSQMKQSILRKNQVLQDIKKLISGIKNEKSQERLDTEEVERRRSVGKRHQRRSEAFSSSSSEESTN